MNKKMVSFRLSPELQARIERVAKATRLKKTTIIEMCVEMELPRIEETYREALAEYDKQHPTEAATLVKLGYFAQKPSPASSTSDLEDRIVSHLQADLGEKSAKPGKKKTAAHQKPPRSPAT